MAKEKLIKDLCDLVVSNNLESIEYNNNGTEIKITRFSWKIEQDRLARELELKKGVPS